MDNPIFTQDEFHRTLTNLSAVERQVISYPCGKAEREHQSNFSISVKDANELGRCIYDFVLMAGFLEHHFSDQFKHNSKARAICPNQDCHGIYAYFYEDFRFCPKCGTKLKFTNEWESNNNQN